MGSLSTPRARPGWMVDRKFAWGYGGLLWVLLLYTAIPVDIFSLGNSDFSQEWAPNPVTRALKLFILATGVCLILWRMSLAKLLLKSINPFLLGFMLLVPLSLIWSIDRDATIARYTMLVTIFCTALAFSLSGWQPHRFQNVIRPVVTLILAGSLVFGIVRPDLAIEIGDGISLKNSWHGLMVQKNQFGQAASFGIIFWFHAWISKQANKAFAFGGMAIAASCLLLSRSSTSLFATIFACTLILLILSVPSNIRRYVPYMVGIFAVVVTVYGIAALRLIPGLEIIFAPVTLFTGKDTTFSARAEIWSIVEEHIKLSPLIGSGYGAYWTGLSVNSPSYVFLSRMFFYPSESHNGYLEIINDLGAVGLTVLFAYFVVYLRQSLQLIRIDRAQAALYLSLFFQHMVINLSETGWLATSSSFTTTIMMTATICIARALLDRRFQRVFGQPRPRGFGQG